MAETAMMQSLEETTDEQQEPMWELAECTCPEYCERDHELD